MSGGNFLRGKLYGEWAIFREAVFLRCNCPGAIFLRGNYPRGPLSREQLSMGQFPRGQLSGRRNKILRNTEKKFTKSVVDYLLFIIALFKVGVQT